jgi:hypothetical protein
MLWPLSIEGAKVDCTRTASRASRRHQSFVPSRAEHGLRHGRGLNHCVFPRLEPNRPGRLPCRLTVCPSRPDRRAEFETAVSGRALGVWACFFHIRAIQAMLPRFDVSTGCLGNLFAELRPFRVHS